MDEMNQEGLEDLLKEAREEEFKLRQKQTFRRLGNITGALIFLNVMPFSIYFLLKANRGMAIVIDIRILQFIAIPLISLLLGAVIGILPFNSCLYRKRLYLSFLLLVLALSTILFLSFLFNFQFMAI